ncbi:UDP-N-acetylmuramoylalanyl-D-glutamate--2,6-diaminopimelate ligase [Haloactinopolyspora alba]|uniref:UDP-N-acetylmuramoyl-L-alanyl-D-glutamate--2,6-diaminopimelate ligase n=1 Tax=Haloactinopolyspora alba TaxID=648780 RepID=A0A2P8E485_9ACTN|nr:UDP-N-acetylmuramoyl-L-alanyl-D-glutamate--2,6-diaminopimelate ligase [Haloactinopolyspora alba]PSL04227.1 UDP-N-acetylmuramoylalanyl-D-glutamate--2,6-diaminopimelate ligase [Haloactinopolyspora alba]
MPDRPGLRPRHVAPRRLAEVVAAARLPVPTGLPEDAGDAVVTGVTHDSRQVRPGDLYMALPGAQTHGARFTAAAIGAGAAAVITDPAGAADAAGAGAQAGAVPVVIVDDPRARMGAVAAHVYGQPARDLLVLGVTGTNGKTTTTYLVEAALRAAGHRTGVIGTVGTRIGGERLDSVRTTPEATDVHALLALMREQDVTACAMEVSSHAMAFGRVDGVVFDVVGFTNLTQDHLDFHPDIEDYFEAKARLFTPEHAERGVVVTDDEFGRRLAARQLIPTTRIVQGTAGVADEAVAAPSRDRHESAPAQPHWTLDRHGALPVLAGPDGQRLGLRVPIPGDFNVTNAALAVVMALTGGVRPEAAVEGVAGCDGVPGRMEPVQVEDPSVPHGVVDFAHSPDAVDNVLRSLPPAGRLIVVVGAGGDRDRDKRPLMGAAAARGADVVVVTDDNPRSEDPAVVRAAVLAGARGAAHARAGDIVEVGGRREAIRAAVAAADAGDVVVVLGKGHEQGQEIAGAVHPFDDRDVLRSELRRRSEVSRR